MVRTRPQPDHDVEATEAPKGPRHLVQDARRRGAARTEKSTVVSADDAGRHPAAGAAGARTAPPDLLYPPALLEQQEAGQGVAPQEPRFEARPEAGVALGDETVSTQVPTPRQRRTTGVRPAVGLTIASPCDAVHDGAAVPAAKQRSERLAARHLALPSSET